MLSDAELEALRFTADPLADRCIAEMLFDWREAGAERLNLRLLSAANRALRSWKTNADLDGWTGSPLLPARVRDPLARFVGEARHLPEWHDPARIARAESQFMHEGVLSCTLLFCASLPECYVVPDLAEVLHTTGQLEKRTEHRIRQTAAMIFPVMLEGGLTTPQGNGVAQVLKVRLIHAMARHLVLQGTPQAALQAKAQVPPRPFTDPRHGRRSAMHQALAAHGWNTPEAGLPCNQFELAYTLLTFGYVILRGHRTLGVPMSAEDERAVLHAWNVVGHLVGIPQASMVQRYEEAAALFERMQRLGRRHLPQPDPRPALAGALMQAMARVIPWRPARPVPVLLTRALCGPPARQDLGLDQHVGWVTRALFALGMGLVRTVDAIGRSIAPGFSCARLLTRVVGYHLLTRLLMDQTRPLYLPGHLLRQAHGRMAQWSEDPKAGRWMNAVEDRLTTSGPWQPG